MRATLHRSRLPLWRAVALVCAWSIGLLGILAQSPELHGHVHDDANTPQHACAVTLFQHGADDPLTGGELLLAPESVASEHVVIPASVAAKCVDLRLKPSCGPPVR